MATLSLENLRKLRETKRKELQKRDTVGKEIQVIVGMGTCGLAAGAKATVSAFIKALDDEQVADRVLIRQTGCMGFCAVEPTVEVIVPGMPTITYKKVDSAAAVEIVKKHIIGRELLNNRVLDRSTAGTTA